MNCDAGEADGDAEPALARIEVTPAEASVKERRTVQLEAKAFDDADDERSDVAFAWASSDETIATVDENGLVTSLKPGEVTISAKAAGKGAEAAITVTEATIESLELSLDSTEIPVDGKVTLRVVITDDEGFELQGRDVVLESEDESVARVEGDTDVFGFGPGETTISAKLGAFEDSVEVRVFDRFTKLFAGSSHACGLTVAGRTLCWGDDQHGQLGKGTGGKSMVPTPVAGQ